MNENGNGHKTTYAEAAQHAASIGFDLSAPAFAAEMARRGNAIRDAYSRPRPEWFKTVERWIITAGDTAVLLLTLVLQYIVPPLFLVFLFAAEVTRVSGGLRLSDNPTMAQGLAWVTVLLYFGLLTISAARGETRYSYTAFSWQSVRENLMYTVGRGRGGKRWEPRQMSRLRQTLNVNALTIIALGSLGSLRNEIGGLEGIWYYALGDLGLSTLPVMLALVTNILVTATMITGSEFAVAFVYAQYSQLRTENHFFGVSPSDIDAQVEQAQLQYLELMLTRYEARKTNGRKNEQKNATPAPPPGLN